MSALSNSLGIERATHETTCAKISYRPPLIWDSKISSTLATLIIDCHTLVTCDSQCNREKVGTPGGQIKVVHSATRIIQEDKSLTEIVSTMTFSEMSF